MTEPFVRTKTKASGALTDAEKIALKDHADKWIKNAFRTGRTDKTALVKAIKDLYKASNMKEPFVVVAPSPLSMALVYGLALTNKIKTQEELDVLLDVVTDSSKGTPRENTIRHSGKKALIAARDWSSNYEGGNAWASGDAYITAMRDVIGLDLPEYEAYKPWEQAALLGGFRIRHDDFCIVSDFPDIITIDDQSRPHGENGPSHKWSDGWSLYYWHGVEVPENWIVNRESVSVAEILAVNNVEQRAAGISIIGMSKMLDALDHKIIDSDTDPEIGDLIEINLPGLPESEFYLRFTCPRNGIMMEAVNKRELEAPKLRDAHAWHANLPVRLFNYPAKRT